MDKNKTSPKIISLIGYFAKIENKSNKFIINGLIIDETKNTILIRTPQGMIKRFPKNTISITLYQDDNYLYLKDGRQIIGTPNERIKRIRHRWTKQH